MILRKLDGCLRKWAGAVRNQLGKLASRTRRLLLTGERNGYRPLKKAKDEGRTVIYVDESACYLLPFVAKSWAPRGQTPLLIEQAGRAHLSLIAAISPTGRLYLAGQDKPFDSDDICWFLNKLCWQYRRQNMLIIWDGAAIHRSQTVRNWLHSRPGRVHLERLPAYSPMLNPVELVWSQLKRSLKNRVFISLESLQAAIMNEVDFLQADRRRIRCFFRKKEVAFFTD